MYIFLPEDSKIAYLYDDVISICEINTARNTFIATPREGVNGQQYKQIETSQKVKTIRLKKKTKQNSHKTGGGGGRGNDNN